MTKKRNQIHVIGHINPDTDSVAAAMGYAWLLQQQNEDDVIAARAGQLNPQTTWVLNRLGLEQPLLLSDASPRFESIMYRFDTTTPERPLREAWSIANRTGGVAPVLNDDGTPYGLVTVAGLFGLMKEAIGAHPRREEMQIGEIMDIPCRQACDTEVPRFQLKSRIHDVLSRILREERSAFWVVDENGRYAGICLQRDALTPPRYRLVLVDHNESGQALGAVGDADLLEILDHHRLGNDTTRTPIRFTVDTVGSTCTLVCERIVEQGLSAPPELAGLLLAGLLSDTLILTSPTTTPRDHQAAERLGRWAFVVGAPLANETVESFGTQLLESGAGLLTRSSDELVATDFKKYEGGGMKFGIAQVEVTNYHHFAQQRESLKAALINLSNNQGMDFVILMVTNVVRKSSRLLLTAEIPALSELPYAKEEDGTLRADGVVSRKKQLLPVVLGSLEG